MKKNLYLMATAMAAALALGACSNDDENMVNGVDLSKPISLSFSPAQIDVQTRATIGVTGAFQNGDEVGLYVSSSTLANADHANIKYTLGANNTWASTPIYWQSGTESYTLTAYYPFAGTENTAAASLAVSLPADQSNADTYTAADRLWAERQEVDPTNEAISMVLNHKMSLLKLDMKAGADMTLEEISKMVPAILGNIPAEGAWDLATGTITAATEEGATTHESIRPYMEYVAETNTLTYYALVMPGTSFAQNSEFLRLTNTSDNTTYSYTLDVQGGIEAGASSYCNLALTVNRTKITLGSFSIGAWQPGKGGSGNVTMDW